MQVGEYASGRVIARDSRRVRTILNLSDERHQLNPCVEPDMCDDCWVQVYTTIFLAETVAPDSHEAAQSTSDRQIEHRLLEIKRTTLECITMLEARNWFTGDLPSDDAQD